MKKYIFIILFLISVFTLSGCGNNIQNKTDFNINEQAMVDDIDIKLVDIEKKSNILEIVFEIKNNRKNTITLNPDINFVMYDINKVQIPNIYLNDSNIIKSKSTMNYTLQYEVTDKQLYEVLFYSGIVENNIKFIITSPNIN